jgi:hypothetical protein
MCFGLAPTRCHGVAGAFGLDAVQQPHRASRRAGSDLQFRVESADVVALRVGGVLVEAGGLVDGFGQVLRDALTTYY